MRRLFELLFVFTLVLTAAVPAMAAQPEEEETEPARGALTAERTVVDSGYCGEHGHENSVKWTLYSDGEMQISGQGPMTFYDDFAGDYAPWNAFGDQITSLQVKPGVTSLGSYAFSGCENLANVTLPDSLTSIESWAFEYCTSLTDITLPDSLTSIENWAFKYCTSLTSITLPNSVTSIEYGTFDNCSSLISVALPDGLTAIRGRAFYHCTSLTSVTLPDSVTYIGDYAFHGCSGLTSVEFLGDAPETVDRDAFPYSDFLIWYHDGTVSWTSPRWEGYPCFNIDQIPTEPGVINADNRNNQLIYFTLNEEAKTAVVGDNSGTDNNCDYLGTNDGHIVLPDTVTKDGVSYKVIGIGQNAFSGSNTLNSIHLGRYISSVDLTAFWDCPNFTAFTVSPDSQRYSAQNGILYDWGKYQLYCYPCNKAGDSFTVPASVQTIGKSAFARNRNLRELTVPNTVTAILSEAFYDCEKLKTLSVPFIGSSLSDGSTLSAVVNPNYYDYHSPLRTLVVTGQGRLKERAFSGGYRENFPLEEIVLPTCGAEIPDSCFEGCTKLRSLRFADQPTPEDGSLIIPQGVTSIGFSAFENCGSFTSVSLPDSLIHLNRMAFAQCAGVKTFTVAPANSAYCNDRWGVLFSKDKSELLYYPAARIWPYYNVSDETIQIGPYAFYSCGNLVNLYIPATVTQFDYTDAISNCPGVTLCVWNGSPAKAYADAHDLTSWAMDNYRLQNIQIEGLPEKPVLEMGNEDMSRLYITQFGGVALQVDDYDLRFSSNQPGPQQLIVTYGGKEARMDVVRRAPAGTLPVTLTGYTPAPGEKLLIAVYDSQGKMLAARPGKPVNHVIQAYIPEEAHRLMDHATAFRLNADSYAPTGAALPVSLQ